MSELTSSQLEIIKSLLRNKFDSLDLSGINYVLNKEYIENLIGIARHYGFIDLAVEMASDYLNCKNDK